MRDTTQRVAAGVVTPALSMLLSSIGDALYRYDAQIFQLELGVVVAAVIFGAPFAVPVALLVRLRHVWPCIPFIALCAAIGIQVQQSLNALVGDSKTLAQSLGALLMLIWFVPALFGTAAALLLKWHERFYLAAVPLAVALALVLTMQGAARARARAPALAAARSWSVLRVGMPVYTGGVGNSKGQRICASLTALFAAEQEQSAQCFTIASGVPAIVDAVIPCNATDPHSGFESPHVRLHARDGSWRGFAEALYLQPDVPEGTLLDLERDWEAPLVIEDDRGAQTLIGGSALVRLLRYEPSRDASLYVEVLNGRHRRLRGWTYIKEVDTGRVAPGEYSLGYPNTSCMNY